MSAEGNGLSLEGLAQRLEALERENTELRSKVATLEGSGTRQSEVAEKRGSNTRWSGDGEAALAFDGQVSRRSLLTKAGAAAVAAVAAGTLVYPRQAKADHFGPGIEVDFVTTHNETPNTVAVFGNSPQGTGVRGEGSNYGVRGVGGPYGVKGEGTLTGVWGSASQTGYEGVFGEHTGTSGYGVVGFGKGDGAGVLGRNSGGPGVQGEYTGTDAGYGVVGKGHYGVKGEGFYGVHGQGNLDGGFGVTGNGGVAGVLGRSSRGIGVEGEGKYGGQFEGSKAQLRLVPKRADTTGPPTGAHTKGEIYMDGAGTLFVCVASSTSTATATWRKVSTTAVS